MTGATVLLALLVSAGSPEQTSRRVHERSNHPDEIEIAPGPRWTSTYAPLEGGNKGASDGAVPAPQEGGGHASEEDDGWEGERWIDPNLVGPLDVEGPEGGEAASEIGVGSGEVEVGGAGFEAPGRPTDPTDLGGRGSSTNSGSAAHVEVEPEPAPEPEPEAEPEPEPQQEPDPEPEVEPVPEPDLEPPPDAPEAASPLPTPPAIGERSPIDAAVDPGPATPPPALEPTPAVDHRPFWFSLLGLGALGLLLRAYLRRRKAKPKAVAVARSTKTTTPRQPSRDLDVTQPELDYAAEIRAMLRAGLIAVGWRPKGRELSKPAREVSAALPSTDRRRGAVRRLVAIAEKVHFAGSEASPADYHGARACVMEIHGREESS